jgi:hypothetical protein
VRRLVGEPPENCDQCGGEAFRPATRREQFARWFVNGAGASTAWYCSNCSASWSGGSSYAVLSAASVAGWRRRVRLPGEVLAGLRRARTWHPMPLFYAAVGAVALVPAVALAALTRLPWWPTLVGVPVAAMTGVFIWSMATARGSGRREVLWRLAPQRAWREELDEELTGLRAQIDDFVLLVPDGWSGALSLDGASWSMPPRGPRVLRDVMTVADPGDPQLDPDRHTPGWRPPAPRVEIRCSRDEWGIPTDQAVSEFLGRALSVSPTDLDGVDQADRAEVERRMLDAHRDHERRWREWQTELADRWRDGSVQVDGSATPARLLTHDATDVGVAVFVHDGQHLVAIVTGFDLDRLQLTEVADPTPLIEEFERRRLRTFT